MEVFWKERGREDIFPTSEAANVWKLRYLSQVSPKGTELVGFEEAAGKQIC